MSSNVVIVYFWTDWMWYCNVQCTQFSRYVAQYGKLCISCIKFWYAFTTNKSAANLAFDDVDVVAEFLWINNFYISTATSRTNMIHTWFTIGFYAFGMTNWNDYTIIISFCIQLVRDSTNVQLLEATIFIVCRVHEKKKTETNAIYGLIDCHLRQNAICSNISFGCLHETCTNVKHFFVYVLFEIFEHSISWIWKWILFFYNIY